MILQFCWSSCLAQAVICTWSDFKICNPSIPFITNSSFFIPIYVHFQSISFFDWTENMKIDYRLFLFWSCDHFYVLPYLHIRSNPVFVHVSNSTNLKPFNSVHDHWFIFNFILPSSLSKGVFCLVIKTLFCSNTKNDFGRQSKTEFIQPSKIPFARSCRRSKIVFALYDIKILGR